VNVRTTPVLIPLLILVALALGGCLAVGQSFKLAEVLAMLAATGTYSVLIATRDRRKYVTSGSKQPNFVGVLKGGFGNPFDVKNAGGQALADTFSDVISKSLKSKGFTATPVVTNLQEAPDQLKQRLLSQSAERVILIDVDEWRSETMARVGMEYDVTLSVMDKEGNVLAKSRIEGKDVLGGSFWNPAGLAKKRVPAALKDHIEKLLNDGAVVSALQG
jgi:hypothetical protein